MNEAKPWLWLLLGIAVLLAVCAITPVPVHAAGPACGTASFYGAESGNRTANGEYFDGSGMTAASRDLPFGSHVRVTVLSSGRSVAVRINDRGPARWTGRVLDLSRGAAARLGIIRAGTARVCLTAIP